MNENNPIEDPESLAALIGKFHGILCTVWPKPGVPTMAGSSVFITTKLFDTLKDGISVIQRAIDNPENADTRAEVRLFWDAFRDLFFRVAAQDSREKSARIDDAMNLLYLASGVLCHRVVELSGNVPEQAHSRAGVESLDDLLDLCHWAAPNRTVKSVFDSLENAMASVARSLG